MEVKNKQIEELKNQIEELKGLAYFKFYFDFGKILETFSA